MRHLVVCAVILAVVLSSFSSEAQANNNALAFDGDGDYVVMLGSIGNPPEGTIMMWTYALSYDLGYNMLNLVIGQGDNLQLGLGDSSLSADGQWVFRLNDGSGMKNAVGPLVTLDQWTHVAATWDGTDIILYLNGVEEARVSAGSPMGGSGVRLGAHPFAFQNFWDGRIDELSVWEVALSQSQIQALRNRTLGPEFYDDPTSGLITYLRCDEDPGSPTALDLTANHNDGTLVGDTDFATNGSPLTFFADGFELGDTSGWSSAYP